MKILEKNKNLLLKMRNSSSYLLQLDRQDATDLVTYECHNQEFINYLLMYGYHYKKGTSTDIRHISEALNIASANVSVGYHNQHKPDEYVNIAEFINSYMLVKKQMENIPTYKFLF